MNVTLRAFLAATLTVGLAVSGPALARKATTTHKTTAVSHRTSSHKTSLSHKASSTHKGSSRHKTVTHKIDSGFAARDAFYSGDVEKAYPLALASGERWVAALSAYRLEDYANAFDLFKQVANDTGGDAWLRSGAAFWASRAAVLAGVPEEETPWLTTAASNPWTFYGMVAENKLGMNPSATFVSTVTAPDVRMALAADPAAQLINASAVSVAADAVDAVMARTGEVGSTAYPTPELAPSGGFTVDPALVYAVVRQESRFNAQAKSRVGARGLMQLMPTTAALTAGDNRFKTDRKLLNDPNTNLKLGQDYLNLLASDMVGDDLLKVVAAYNGGPGAVLKTLDRMGSSADPFMFIESLPAKETRDYVEKVVAGYWLYRRQFGQDTPSLDALASGNVQVSINFDRSYNAGPRIEPPSFTNARLQPVSASSDDRPTLRRLF